jgi:hypothetical protein
MKLLSPLSPVRASLIGTFLLAALGMASAAAPVAKGKKAPPAAVGPVSYNRDIRPILAENCFACHGMDSASRKAGLRLDKFAAATAKTDDGIAIVPGNPAASLVIQRISRPDKDSLRMPPAEGHKSLTPDQKRMLTLWIAQGAKYEPHWAFIAPQKPALPAVHNAAWVRNPIDRFVLAKLESNGLAPAPEADRRTLARRVSLDLTGLPPDPAEVDRFVADKTPTAYEKLVDKYLASTHYGEHRARYWLDAARYADTNGIHFDNYRETWAYRDWVINAFNKNEPFSQFTLEQLAGDLLPSPTLDQRIATGFIRCNITTNEGGSIPEEVAVSYTRDRTETASQVFLGVTAGCAVCHDHKFDPISQKEFYSLSAFFNNTTQAPLDGNVKDTAPTIPVPMPADRARFAALTTDLPAAQKAVVERKVAARSDFDKWLASPAAKVPPAEVAATIPTDGLRFHAPLDEGQGREINATLDGQTLKLAALADPLWNDGAVSAKAFQRTPGSDIEAPNAGDFDKTDKWTAAAWVKLPKTGNGGSIIARMDDLHDFRGWDMWIQGDRVAMTIVNKWPMNAVKVVTRGSLERGIWHHVCEVYNGGLKKNSITIYFDGVPQATDAEADVLKDTIRTTVPFTIGQRHTTAGVDGTGIQDVRIYGRALPPAEVAGLVKGTRAVYLTSLLADPTKPLTPGEKDELFNWWVVGADPVYKQDRDRQMALDAEQKMILARGTVAHVAQEKPGPEIAYVLNRGEYDQRRDMVNANVPAFLPPLPANLPQNRLALAKEILLPNNPLTARVTVNRFWQQIFGAGIVRTTGDFGVMGELSSDQPLLDFLAVDFRDSGWNVKRFYKQIVMSATYRQSSVETPEKRLKDPADVLLSRGPRFRMDGEMVRDYALAASGLLVPKIGGPSVKPYQPDGVWEAVAMLESNTHFYKRDMGENLYRRSMYTFWKRAAPPASLDIFNAPTREVCTVRRERTDTPLQALVTMNDPQFVEAARYLGQRALKNETTLGGRMNFLAQHLLLRSLRSEEFPILKQTLTDLTDYYKANPKDAGALVAVGDSKADPAIAPETLAAWTMLTNQMMNLDEVLNK